MNTQELKEQVSSLPSELILKKIMVNKDSVLGLIDQLDQPQKVVIPKFVAEWIVLAGEKCLTLRQALDHYSLEGEIEKWLQYASNQELFARAWLNGYEVEQEKLYTVEIPDPHNGVWKYTVLYRLETNNIRIVMVDNYNWRQSISHQLTEDEIRKDFDWAWKAGFAKEVE